MSITVVLFGVRTRITGQRDVGPRSSMRVKRLYCKQQKLEAGVNALAIYMAPVRNSDGIITGCPFGEHFNEIVSVKLRQVII